MRKKVVRTFTKKSIAVLVSVTLVLMFMPSMAFSDSEGTQDTTPVEEPAATAPTPAPAPAPAPAPEPVVEPALAPEPAPVQATPSAAPAQDTTDASATQQPAESSASQESGSSEEQGAPAKSEATEANTSEGQAQQAPSTADETLPADQNSERGGAPLSEASDEADSATQRSANTKPKGISPLSMPSAGESMSTKVTLDLVPGDPTGTDAEFARPTILATLTDADGDVLSVRNNNGAKVTGTWENASSGKTGSFPITTKNDAGDATGTWRFTTANAITPGTYTVTGSYAGADAWDSTTRTTAGKYEASTAESLVFTVVKPDTPAAMVEDATNNGTTIRESDGSISVTGTGPFEYSSVDPARATPSDWTAFGDSSSGTIDQLSASTKYYIRSAKRVDGNTIYLASDAVEATVGARAPIYHTITFVSDENATWSNVGSTESILDNKGVLNTSIKGKTKDTSASGFDYIVTELKVEPEGVATVEYDFATGNVHITNATEDITITPVVERKYTPANIEIVSVTLNPQTQKEAGWLEAVATVTYELLVTDKDGNPCPKVTVQSSTTSNNAEVKSPNRSTDTDGKVYVNVQAKKGQSWEGSAVSLQGTHPFTFKVKDTDPEVSVERALTVVQPDPLYSEAGADGVRYVDIRDIRGVSAPGARDGAVINLPAHTEYFTWPVRYGDYDAPFITPDMGDWASSTPVGDGTYQITGLYEGSWGLRYEQWFEPDSAPNTDTAHLFSAWNLAVIPRAQYTVTIDEENSENATFDEKQLTAGQGGFALFHYTVPQGYVLDPASLTCLGGSQTAPGYTDIYTELADDTKNAVDAAIAGDTKWVVAVDGVTRNLTVSVKAFPITKAKVDTVASRYVDVSDGDERFVPGNNTVTFNLVPKDGCELTKDDISFVASDGTSEDDAIESVSYDAASGKLEVVLKPAFAKAIEGGKTLSVVAVARNINMEADLAISIPSSGAKDYVGYDRPDPWKISIANTGNAAAEIVSVTSSSDDFEIAGSGNEVAAGATLDTWTVQPKAGLAEGSYRATITVEYKFAQSNGSVATKRVVLSGFALMAATVSNGNQTAQGEVEFTVLAKQEEAAGGQENTDPGSDPGTDQKDSKVTKDSKDAKQKAPVTQKPASTAKSKIAQTGDAATQSITTLLGLLLVAACGMVLARKKD